MNVFYDRNFLLRLALRKLFVYPKKITSKCLCEKTKKIAYNWILKAVLSAVKCFQRDSRVLFSNLLSLCFPTCDEMICNVQAILIGEILRACFVIMFNYCHCQEACRKFNLANLCGAKLLV